MTHIGTSNNIERTFERDLTFSRFMRTVEGVRHLDLDLYQYCPSCSRIQVVFEATATRGFKNTTMTRALAAQLNVPMILVQHAYSDVEFKHDVDVTYWGVGKWSTSGKRSEGLTWSAFSAGVEKIRDSSTSHNPGCSTLRSPF